MKNKKRYKQLRKSYKNLQKLGQIHARQMEDLEIDNTTLRVLQRDADAALARLRMLIVAWSMEQNEQTTFRLAEEGRAIEEEVRAERIALPVDIDTLRGTVLP